MSNAKPDGAPIIPEGAPPGDQWQRAWHYVHDCVNPLGKVAADMTAIGERTTTSESRTAEPESTAAYLARRSGLRPIHGETGEQRLEWTARQIQARAEITGRFLAQVEAEMTGKPNPYAAGLERIKDRLQLKRRLENTRQYLVQEIEAPSNVVGGQVSPEGQKRIREARLLLGAIADRLDALGAK
jgi:hypothetical protein